MWDLFKTISLRTRCSNENLRPRRSRRWRHQCQWMVVTQMTFIF